MPLDSSEIAYRKALAARFIAATAKSFAFLEDAGFAACPWSSQSPDEYRDCVVVFEYERVVSCSQRNKPQRVLDLDEWTELNGLVTPPPLSWRKKNTLYEEVPRNLKHFFKQVDRDLDAAVDFMATPAGG